MAGVTKRVRLDLLRSRLGTDIRWARRGLVRIFERQTSEERVSEQTREDNGIGFTGPDAPLLTSFAKQLQERGWLSFKQDTILLKLMPKYAGQLLTVSNLQTLDSYIPCKLSAN